MARMVTLVEASRQAIFTEFLMIIVLVGGKSASDAGIGGWTRDLLDWSALGLDPAELRALQRRFSRASAARALIDLGETGQLGAERRDQPPVGRGPEQRHVVDSPAVPATPKAK